MAETAGGRENRCGSCSQHELVDALAAENDRLRVMWDRSGKNDLLAEVERLRDAANRAALALDHDDWCHLADGWPGRFTVTGDTAARSCTCRHAEALAAFRAALDTPEGEQ